MAHITLGGKPLNIAALVRQRIPGATSREWKPLPRSVPAAARDPYWHILPMPDSNFDVIGTGATEEAAWLDAWQRQEEAIAAEQRLADEG